MKRCTRFHIEDVESGDLLHFTMPEEEAQPQDGPSEFDLTVSERYQTVNFGWVIRGVVDGVGPGTEFYLADGWDVSVAAIRAESGPS